MSAFSEMLLPRDCKLVTVQEQPRAIARGGQSLTSGISNPLGSKLALKLSQADRTI